MNKPEEQKEMQILPGGLRACGDHVSGIFEGYPARVRRTWGRIRFNDEDMVRLFDGEVITVKDYPARNGSRMDLQGRLKWQTWRETSFCGFALIEQPERQKKSFPKSWCGYVFSDEDIRHLQAGNKIAATGCLSRKGSRFDCLLRAQKQEEGGWKLIPEFYR